jgi:hypothetical protein
MTARVAAGVKRALTADPRLSYLAAARAGRCDAVPAIPGAVGSAAASVRPPQDPRA